MKSIAIIGAGITGLTTAYYLKRQGVPVTVYETGARAGGAIRSIRQDGFLAEFGPNTLLETSPKIAQLIRDLNLESRRLDSDPKAEARFVVRGGRPVAMPASQLGIFTSALLSVRAKCALLREPFVTPRRDGGEESVAEFVTRRLNREFLDRLVDALVAGIYAGDPQKLSVQHAFPRLALTEAKYGSLIKGQFYGARERKKTGEVSRERAAKISFDEGLQVLPDALAAQLGEALKLNTAVTKLTQVNGVWILQLNESGRENFAEHSAVIYCGTAHRLAELEIIYSRAALPRSLEIEAEPQFRPNRAFSEIHHPPVASVVLGFRREDVTHPCNGFGMLIPKIENFKILGTIFSSSLFPNRAPDGRILLTTYVGGERQPELATLPPEKLVALVCKDLRVLFGVRGKPVFSHIAFHPKAIPQYNVGYGKFKKLLDEIESQAHGLFFAGHFRDGVSLADSIVSGSNMAERVAKTFSTAIARG